MSHFFEDFAVGRRFLHATPRSVTSGDVALYIALTGARAPLHCNEPLARSLGYASAPVDDLLAFHIAFGKTVADISYNAVANLGYADARFLEPVYVGDTIGCESEVIGLREASNGRSGVVYVRSHAFNQHGREVLTWARWVMVEKRDPKSPPPDVIVPALPREVDVARLTVPAFLRPEALDARTTGSERRWEDFAPGQTLDHPGGMTLEEADHMLATRLYQNTARVHFDAFLARDSAFGKRLVYGGHVISVCRALAYDGLENVLGIAAINSGTHANPTFAGDTLYCRHMVVDCWAFASRPDLGALRLRMIGAKNVKLSDLPPLAPGGRHEAVVLDLDYTVLIARRKAK